MNKILLCFVVFIVFINFVEAGSWYFSGVTERGLRITYHKSKRSKIIPFIRLPHKYRNLFLLRDFTDTSTGKVYKCHQIRLIVNGEVAIFNAFTKRKKDLFVIIPIKNLKKETRALLGYK